MKTQVKLSAEERRAAIIQAVRRVFADKGFHGTTTRELADAAGVSEALLFKHFPNKEALYSAMQLSCCNPQDREAAQRIRARTIRLELTVALDHWANKRAGSRWKIGQRSGWASTTRCPRSYSFWGATAKSCAAARLRRSAGSARPQSRLS